MDEVTSNCRWQLCTTAFMCARALNSENTSIYILFSSFIASFFCFAMIHNLSLIVRIADICTISVHHLLKTKWRLVNFKRTFWCHRFDQKTNEIFLGISVIAFKKTWTQKTFISFSSSNTQFYESRIFCLFTVWVFFPDKSFRLKSKYTLKMPKQLFILKRRKNHFATP
jgi:hypothetical protein